MIQRKKKECKGKGKASDWEGCGEFRYIFGHGLCESCYREWYYKENGAITTKKTKIKPFSAKREKLNTKYKSLRIKILTEANFKCFIDGCTNVANTIEHQMGRKGYADEYAREHDIPLLIDERYLKPCCLHHNGQLETDPELAKIYQYSKISGKPKKDL